MNWDSGILLIFGIGVFGGVMSAIMMKKLSIPQVLGYIVAGIIIGESGLRLVTVKGIEQLKDFNYFALGIIGFLVGSEIRFSTLKKYGKQFSAILLAEGILAFSLVGMFVTLVMWEVTHNFSISFATGMIFGSIASATDPASTIDVLWEYRTAGILTTTLIAIVALDDALAMTLYGLGTSVAQILTGGSVHLGEILIEIGFELFGAVIFGVIAGFVLNFILHRSFKQEQILSASISLLLLDIWVAVILNMDIILLAMSMGITLVNLAPKRSKKLIDLIRSFSTPLYIMFFVLVGARLSIGNMPSWLWLIIALYVLGRSAGKMVGSYLGGKISNAAAVVRKYTGLGLFAQGGVAIGLSIMASQHLSEIQISSQMTLADVIIFGVTATTFIVQVIGPPTVKLAVKLAGEIGKKVTAEDIIDNWKAGDVANLKVVPLEEHSRIKDVIETFSQQGYSVYPIVQSDGKVVGTLSINELRNVMNDPDCWDWLVASDVMAPLKDYVTEKDPLKKSIQMMNQIGTDQVLVLSDDEKKNFIGFVSKKDVERRVNKEMIGLHAA